MSTGARFTPEQKAAIIRRRLLEGVSMSVLCGEFGIDAAQYDEWQTQFFENAAKAFERRASGEEPSRRTEAKEPADPELAPFDAPSRPAAEMVAELADTTLDLDRGRRCGYPEVIYGEGKPAETLAAIASRLLEDKTPVLMTRVSADKAERLSDLFPAGRYNSIGRTFRIDGGPSEHVLSPIAAESRRTSRGVGRVAVVTAGTSDLPVAEEARETLDWMGVEVDMIHDVGVAGPHRLPRHVERLRQADAVVVVAGMEGALPSVVGGYVACPVIAVPTSVGYGANFGGLAALLGMLNSCAANVVAVNIDAGFKGAYVAGLIAARSAARMSLASDS